MTGTQLRTQNPPPDRPKKGKDKKIFSCHSCRRRKLKCDRFDPCGACQARGEGDRCTWEEGQRPERHHCESLEQLPRMISNLSKEVQELKLLSSSLMENIRGNGGENMTETLAAMTPDTQKSSIVGLSSDVNSSWGLQSSNVQQWTSYKLMALLPASPLLRGLISHYIFASASLTGFIDIHRLITDVEEIEHLRQGFDVGQASRALEVKVSRILACASLAAVDLEPGKAQELGIEVNEVDDLVRNLYRKARMLITPNDEDTMSITSFSNQTAKSTIPNMTPNNLGEPSNNGLTSHTPPPTSSNQIILDIVSIKIILLISARSFAAPSDYLKLHLDVISSAVNASTDSFGHAGMSYAESEWRWQLWSTLCVLDWTSPGIYHHGSYFIRAEMHRSPPLPTPVADDSYGLALDQRRQTRHYLEYALAIAHLARRAEDCILQPGPVSPNQAADLCAELDTLDHNLSFYQLLGSQGPFSVRSTPSPRRNTVPGGEGNENLPRRAPQVQKMHLSLELGLIRFKLFRHEAFYLMHNPSAATPLQLMCLDACMDACIFVLAQCRRLGNGDGVDQLPDILEEAERPCTGSLRRVLQPASSAALVAQVLLHESQAADGMGILGRVEPPPSGREFFAFVSGAEDYWGNPTKLSAEKIGALQWHVNKVLSLLEAMQETSSLARFKLSLHTQCK
ncbi:C6 finger domain protein [Penicillium taxi]|uniref:C6 finger domain protein n=1 Tax=Penicillium taxi TaxID=168475 RepID=UPI0025450A5D|nr:C6 finger domain protein [Penicillium taxi]KAJ5894305.1 C6 finger domain protein [Penicillium taxi]